MDASFLQWLPAITTVAGIIWLIASMKANVRESDKRHESHDRQLSDHETRIRGAESAIVGLKVFDELQQRRKDVPA